MVLCASAKRLSAPSITEGFGLPVAEALLAGCRVVCSDIPAHREVGDGHCRFVALQRNAEDALLEAIACNPSGSCEGTDLSPAVFFFATREAVHQPLSQTGSACCIPAESQVLHFAACGSIGRAIAMKAKERRTMFQCRRDEHVRT